MVKVRRLALILGCLLMAVFMSACGNQVSSLSFESESVVMQVNTTKNLSVLVSPSTLSDTVVSYTSSNTLVASIANGNMLLAKAVGSARIYASSGKVTTHFDLVVVERQTELQIPTGIRFDEITNKIVWNAVENATKYEIKLNGNVYETPALFYDENILINSTNMVQVRALAEGTAFVASPYSSEVSFSCLGNPENVSFNKDTQILSWTAIEGVSYHVNINGTLDIVQTTGSYQTNFAQAGTYELSVVAVKDNIFSACSDKISVRKLGKTENVRIENNKLLWDSVSGAQSYSLLISSENQQTITVQTNQFDFSSLNVSSGAHTVKIVAMSGESNVVSGASTNDFAFNCLPSSAGLTQFKNQISWGAVVSELGTGDVSYAVKVYKDGVLVPLMGTDSILSTNFIIPNGLAEGNYEVRIYAFKTDTVSTGFASVSYTLSQLVAPTIASFDETTKTLVINASTDADEVVVKVDNVLQAGTITKNDTGFTFVFDNISIFNEAKIHSVVASVSNDTSSSLIASEPSVSYSIERLAIPEISMVTDTLSFTRVSRAVSYDLYISNNSGASFSKSMSGQNVSYSFLTESAGTYQAKARAIGNGNTILSSAESLVFTNIVKLSSPTLSFDKVNKKLLIAGTIVSKPITLTVVLPNESIVTIEAGAVTEYAFDYVESGVYKISGVNCGTETNEIKSLKGNEIDITILASTGDVVYSNDNDTSSVTFDGVVGADGYIFTVNSVNISAVYQSEADGKVAYTLGTTSTLFPSANSFEIIVKAYSNSSTIFASTQSKITIKRLSKISSITGPDNNGVFSWEGNSDAIGYDIVFDGGDAVRVTTPTITIDSISLGQHSLSVRTIGNDISSLSSINVFNLDFEKRDTLADINSVEYNNVGGENALSFVADQRATSFKVYVSDIEVFGTATTTNGTTTFVFNEETSVLFPNANSYVIKVVSYSDNTYISESGFASITITRLANISDFTFTNSDIAYTGLISWEAIENNDGYEIYINGEFFTNTVKDATSINLSGLNFGNNTVKVRALGDEKTYLSALTFVEKTVLHTYKLESPQISFNKTTMKLTVLPVVSATSYTVQIGDGEEFDCVVDGINYSYTFIDQFDNAGDYSIKVRAKNLGDTNTTPSEPSLITVTRLAIVSGILKSGDNIVWDSSANSNVTYSVVFGVNDPIIVQNAQVSISAFAKGQYSVFVKAISSDANTLNSIAYSDAFSFEVRNLVSAPTNLEFKKKTLTYENYTLSFDTVTDAVSYKIFVNNILAFTIESETGRQTYTFLDSYINALQAGRYTLTIKTVPIAGLYLDESIASTPIVFEKLATPTGLTISDTENVSFVLLDSSKSSGYEVKSIIDGEGQGISYSNLSEYDGTILLTVRNLGISDLFVESDYVTYTITRLSTPTKPFLQNDKICWNNNNDSIGAKISIKQNGSTDYENTFDLTIANLDYNFTPSLSYNITAQFVAESNQNEFLSSRVSEALIAIKLACPTNVTLEASGTNQEGTILVSWNHDGIETEKYSIYVNGSLVGATLNAIEKEYTLSALESGNTYSVSVVANGINENGYVSSSQSEVAVTQRLSTVSGVTISQEGYLRWNALTGAQSYTVEIYSTKLGGIIPNSTKSLASNITSFDYGSILLEGDYAGALVIKIRAIGNATTLLSSDLYNFNATKLQETTLTATENSIETTVVENGVVSLFVSKNATNVSLTLVDNVFELPDSNEWEAGSYTFVSYVLPASQTNNIIRSKTVTKTVTRLEKASISGTELGFMRDAVDPDITLLKWSTVSNAIKYELKLNNSTIQSSSAKSFVLNNTIPVGDLNFTLVAIGTTGTYFSSRTTIFSAYKLAEISELKNDNGNFAWTFTESDKATNLKIVATKSGVDTSFVVSDPTAETSDLFGVYGLINVKMRAIGNAQVSGAETVVLDSNYTAQSTFTKLDAPTNLRSVSGILTVDNVSSSTTYDLTVSLGSNAEENAIFDLTTYYLTEAFENFVLDNTQYNAKVKARKVGFLTSDISNIVSFMLYPYDVSETNFRIERVDDETSQLAWDTLYDESNNPIDVGGYRVRKYMLSNENAEIDESVSFVNGSTNVFTLASPNVNLNVGQNYFRLSIVGTSATDGNGNYWLSSRYFGNLIDNKISAYKLATPTPTVNFGKIVWSNTEDVVANKLFIIENINTTEVYSGNAFAFELANLATFASETVDKTYYMNMMAIGDGVSTISSTFSSLNNKQVILPKMPGEIIVVDGGFRFANTEATNNYYANAVTMDYPTTAIEKSVFNPNLGFIEIRLTSETVDRYAYVWPELLKAVTGSPFASKIDSAFTVAAWYDGTNWLTYNYGEILNNEKTISYFGIDELFPGIAKGTYNLSYRQMGDNTNLLSSKYSINVISVNILDNVKNVKIVESTVDFKPYLEWSAVLGVENAGESYVPTYQIVAYNENKQWWDCLYETTDTKILIDNTELFGGETGVTFLYPYHKKITVILKGNTSATGVLNYISSPRAIISTLNISVLKETEQFGVENGLLTWSKAINPVCYSIKYSANNIDNEYLAISGETWGMQSVQPGLYSIIVQAIGNKNSTGLSCIINGKPSSTKKFYKLQAPNVSVSWGYFVWTQIQVESTENNIQFIADKYLSYGSLNAVDYTLLDSTQCKYLTPSPIVFNSSAVWKMEYIAPVVYANYFKFVAYGSQSAYDSGYGFVNSDMATIPGNISKSRLSGFQPTETIEVLEGKLVWTRKDVAPLSNYYWLEFTKLETETATTIYELVSLPSVYPNDTSKVQYSLSDTIVAGKWKVAVKNTNSSYDLNSLASATTEFVKLENISGQKVENGVVKWNTVTWNLEDTTNCAIIIEFEDSESSLNKYYIKADPASTELNSNTVLSQYAEAFESIPAGEWYVRVKTSSQSSTINVVDSVWQQIGLVPIQKLEKVDVGTISKVGNDITWTAPDQLQVYSYDCALQLKNDETKIITNVVVNVSTASYSPTAGYSVMSIKIQVKPTGLNIALASSWSEIAVFTALSAPPTAIWNTDLKGFELRIPLNETVPNLYSYSISVQFKATGNTSFITYAPILQSSTEPVYYPMLSGTYKIAYAIVVGGVIGAYQTVSGTSTYLYCTEQIYNDFGSGDGSLSNPFIVTRTTNMSNIKYRSWACFRQTEGTATSPVTVTESILGQKLWATRIGNTMTFSAVSTPFTGNYNGNGKTIQFALIGNTSASSEVGIFAKVGTYAEITNLVIKSPLVINLTFMGRIYIGLLAGQIVNHLMISGEEPAISFITISSSGLTINFTNVSGGNSAIIYYGSIAGNIDGANLTQCISNVNVSFGNGNASSFFAGIVGYASSETAYTQTVMNRISKCINNGTISGTMVAGLVCNASLTIISECANKQVVSSSVSGTNFESSAYAAVAGGLVALASRCEFEYSYNSGSVSIKNSSDLSTIYTLTSFVGGLVARAESSIIMRNCYNVGTILSDTVNNTITKRGGFMIGFVISCNPTGERNFYLTLNYPTGVTAYSFGAPKSQADMQSSEFIGTTSTTLSSTYFVYTSGNYPKLIWES